MVYDVTDAESFENVKNWMTEIDRFAKEGVLRVLVGNKCDLEEKRKISTAKGKELKVDVKIQREEIFESMHSL